MIQVIATIELHAGRRDAFLEIFHRLVPQVRAERGCLEYGPMIDLATTIGAQMPVRANVVVVAEKWESIAALEAHLQAPHMAEYRKTVKDLVVKVTLQVLQPA
jgi:quinol monooxygenase YgiN